jgi:carboxylesterase 2
LDPFRHELILYHFLNIFLKTQYGLVRGIPGQQNGSITRFLGIPFAASTAGTARWRPSQPATNWSGIFNATTYGPICIQFQRMSSFTMSEDCLNLNIWTGQHFLQIIVQISLLEIA